jgi:acyl-CoA synthetase (AMP-forming)/AMP-acid ligase II
VVNERGEEIRADEKEVGEIVVKGDIVTKGYWKLPEETAKAIRDGWLFTDRGATRRGDGGAAALVRPGAARWRAGIAWSIGWSSCSAI